MRFAALAAISAAFLFLAACASAPLVFHPYRVCVVDRKPPNRFRVATVIEVREDGARRVRFDDPNEGDRGFQWIDGDDSRLVIRPCAAATVSPFSAETVRW